MVKSVVADLEAGPPPFIVTTSSAFTTSKPLSTTSLPPRFSSSSSEPFFSSGGPASSTARFSTTSESFFPSEGAASSTARFSSTSSKPFHSSDGAVSSTPRTSSSFSRSLITVTSTTKTSTTSPRPPPTEPVSVIHPADNAASNSGWTTGQIAATAVCSVVVLLGLVAWILFLFVRRRQRRQLADQDDPDSRSIGSVEKYSEDDSKYSTSRYSTYLKSSSEALGTTPLLQVQVPSIPIRNTEYKRESRFYHDGPVSPFINGDDGMAKASPKKMVSFRDATPFAQPQQSRLDSVELLSSASTALRPASLQLPPLSIPARVSEPPSRRSSKGKRNSRRAADVLDPGNESDDTDSLYSQASGSTASLLTYQGTTRSRTQSLLLPATPLSPIPQFLLDVAAQAESPVSDSRASIITVKPFPSIALGQGEEEAGGLVGENVGTAQVASFVSDPRASIITVKRPPSIALGQGEEEAGGLVGENAVVVAQLLKLRQRNTSNPDLPPVSRSSSNVSHIERKGSIKPVLLSSLDDFHSQYRRPRRVRDAVKSHDSIAEVSMDRAS